MSARRGSAVLFILIGTWLLVAAFRKPNQPGEIERLRDSNTSDRVIGGPGGVMGRKWAAAGWNGSWARFTGIEFSAG